MNHPLSSVRQLVSLRSAGRVASVAVLCASAALLSCTGSPAATADSSDDVLIQIGDSSLTLRQVVNRIPVGLDPADSANLFNTIVDTWIQNRLLYDVARANLTDMSRIEAMVDEYRNQLIVSEYRRRIKEENVKAISDDSIRAYYRNHLAELLLEHPLIKGIYIKLPEKAGKVEQITEWVRRARPEDIDNLERDGLREAIQYDYFADKWMDWQVVAEQIPYRFYDPDAFVESTPFFSTTYNGSLYLLHITESLHTGDTMPYEFASPLIAERLNASQRARYEERLVNSLYRQALRDGKLRKVTYDPVTHQRILPSPKETENKR